MTKPLHALPPLPHESLWSLEFSEGSRVHGVVRTASGKVVDTVYGHQEDHFRENSFVQRTGELASIGVVLDMATGKPTPSAGEHSSLHVSLRAMKLRLSDMELEGAEKHLDGLIRSVGAVHNKRVRQDINNVNQFIAERNAQERYLYLRYRPNRLSAVGLARLERFAVGAMTHDGRAKVVPVLRGQRSRRGGAPADSRLEPTVYESIKNQQ